LAKSEDPEKIREELHKLVPIKLRKVVNWLFVEFGKDVCKTAKPMCGSCAIKMYCKYYREKVKD
jgi:endonuclease-3